MVGGGIARIFVVFVLGITRWNSATGDNARMGTTTVHENDFDPKYETENSKKDTTTQKHVRLYLQIMRVYTK